MEEYIDILDRHGKPLNQCATKSKIHENGHYHNTAHVWLYSAEGAILLAQRAASKIIFPLLWDVSAAGHVDAGESIEIAAIREVEEELGILLKPSDLNKIGVFESFVDYENGLKDYEFHNTFIAPMSSKFNEFNLNLEEVAQVKWVSIEEFNTLLSHSEHNGHFVTSNVSYYEYVIGCIVEAI